MDAYERMYEEIRRRGDCLTLKELAVSGKDLIGAGIKPGKQIGEILNTLLALVLEDTAEKYKRIFNELYFKEPVHMIERITNPPFP